MDPTTLPPLLASPAIQALSPRLTTLLPAAKVVGLLLQVAVVRRITPMAAKLG